ncbi:MAG: HlyC/CorC family transporter [Gammaproteobacteria bacterium]|nr:HlyC/CorC family transporter [Gammaproteobacteria bacterium]
MNDIPLAVLFSLLGILLLLSGFFSGSETALMTINRYRLAHRARNGERAAKLTQKLLERPDRLIGLILLGNNLVNILAASIATVIGIRLFGQYGIGVASAALTVVVLLFGEVTPKTLAALHPERVALPASYVYWVLKWPLFPIVWVINLIGNGILKLLGVSPEDVAQHSLSSEELRSVVAEAGAMIPQRHQAMLLSVLDLERVTVEDIMVPRNEIIGIDLGDSAEEIREQLTTTEHTRLPLFDGSIDDLRGIVHVRDAMTLAVEDRLSGPALLQITREPYYVPESTPLNQQLLNFQNQKRRLGFVVDEYGDIQGLVTLTDILQEIVGEFTPDPSTQIRNVFMDEDGSYLINGSVTLRGLNRSLGWKLPTTGPRTVNGLIMEQLEKIPKTGDLLELRGYTFEITEVRANAVKTARIRTPQMNHRAETPERTRR